MKFMNHDYNKGKGFENNERNLNSSMRISKKRQKEVA